MNFVKIRPEQISSSKYEARRDFESRALQHVRQFFPEESKAESDDVVIERVRAGEKKAAAYGLVTQKQIISFVDAGYVLGPQFDDGVQYPEIKKLLEDPTLDPTNKAGMVLGWAYGRRSGRQAGGPGDA